MKLAKVAIRLKLCAKLLLSQLFNVWFLLLRLGNRARVLVEVIFVLRRLQFDLFRVFVKKRHHDWRDDAGANFKECLLLLRV
jgi:hypothetical protein